MEEARDSQRLFFISKELQLNTKFHYMEVTSTSGDYKIFLRISKITISESVLHICQHPVKAKTTRKGKRKRGRERVRKRRGEGVICATVGVPESTKFIS